MIGPPLLIVGLSMLVLAATSAAIYRRSQEAEVLQAWSTNRLLAEMILIFALVALVALIADDLAAAANLGCTIVFLAASLYYFSAPSNIKRILIAAFGVLGTLSGAILIVI
jgi:hypothetical protein